METRRIAPLVLAALLGCDALGGPPDLSTPSASAQGFLASVKRRDCVRAWQHLSLASRAAARELGERSVRDGLYYVDSMAPVQVFCASNVHNRFLSMRAGDVAPVLEEGDRAQVGTTLGEGRNFLIPGFFPTSESRVDVTLDLVREEGEWRMEVGTHVTPERGWSERVVDGVAVRWTGGPGHWRIWALADLDVGVAEVERAVMDWPAWPGWVPGLRAAGRVGATRDDDPILRVRFADPLGGSTQRNATFSFRRYTSGATDGPGFSSGALPLRQPVPEPPPEDGEPLDLGEWGFAAYPDPDGVSRVQVVFVSPAPELRAEHAAALLRALEHQARAGGGGA